MRVKAGASGAARTAASTIGEAAGAQTQRSRGGGDICASVFDVVPEVFSRIFEWPGKAFDVPLVPDTAAKAKRATK
jgi:hypothetical protein